MYLLIMEQEYKGVKTKRCFIKETLRKAITQVDSMKQIGWKYINIVEVDQIMYKELQLKTDR